MSWEQIMKTRTIEEEFSKPSKFFDPVFKVQKNDPRHKLSQSELSDLLREPDLSLEKAEFMVMKPRGHLLKITS